MKNILFIIIFLIISRSCYTQIERAQIIAAYINNFARYTYWPNENLLDSFRIALFTENTDIIKEFERFSKKRMIKNKPINISINTSLPIADNIQIILLTSDKSDYLLGLYDSIEGQPVLLVSENYKDKRNVMINLYENRQNQLLFEVNKANIINQNLIIDPEILLAGGTEIDVAGLYRKSQLSLRSMQKDIDKIKDSLGYYQSNIQASIKQINKQQIELSKQKKLLEISNTNMLEQQKGINLQENILLSQKDSIHYKNQILRKQIKDAKQLEKVLKSKQNQIAKLNLEMKNKNIVMSNQSVTIVRQKQMLILLIVIAMLTIFLGVTIFISYRNNKQKSSILTNQKTEIEKKLKELEQLNIKLQNADRYKSIFLASMSHELRTPLNSIIGYTGILLMGMTGKLNDEQNKQLNKVKNNAKHLLDLINDILDISKIEADRVELNFENFNLKKIVIEVVEIIQPKVLEKQLTLTAEIPDDLIISSDVRRIKQVLLNLVSNAVNYTDSGNIKITAQPFSKNKFKLSVQDTGVGISEQDIERLFQPFQQIDSSLTKKNKGTGLGLYLCKKLMTLMKGEICVKSIPGKGSDFYIIMPITT